MPATWAGLRARYGLGPDPFDVRDNIMAGTGYLREMHDRYGNAIAMLAAYNAGPGRYDDYVSSGRPLPAETVGYLAPLTAVVSTPAAALQCVPFARAETGIAIYGNAKTWWAQAAGRSEAHTSELQSLMRSSYAVVCL